MKWFILNNRKNWGNIVWLGKIAAIGYVTLVVIAWTVTFLQQRQKLETSRIMLQSIETTMQIVSTVITSVVQNYLKKNTNAQTYMLTGKSYVLKTLKPRCISVAIVAVIAMIRLATTIVVPDLQVNSNVYNSDLWIIWLVSTRYCMIFCLTYSFVIVDMKQKKDWKSNNAEKHRRNVNFTDNFTYNDHARLRLEEVLTNKIGFELIMQHAMNELSLGMSLFHCDCLYILIQCFYI